MPGPATSGHQFPVGRSIIHEGPMNNENVARSPCASHAGQVSANYLSYEAPTSCKALPLVSTPMVRTIMQAIQKKAAMVMNIP